MLKKGEIKTKAASIKPDASSGEKSWLLFEVAVVSIIAIIRVSRQLASAVKRSGILQKVLPVLKSNQSRWTSLALLVVISLLGASRMSVFAAPDLQDAWNLGTATDYTHDDGIEITGGVARLKAQNYTSDANTRALYHFDEASGTNVTDSSSQAIDGNLTGGSFTVGNLNNAVSLNGVSDYISVPNNASLQLGQQQTVEAWTKFNAPFNNTDEDRRYQIVDKGDYQLYFDNETGKLTYELADANANSWSQIGGNDLNNGWDINGKLSVNALIKSGSHVFAGIGATTGDAEVWESNGSTWQLIGGGAQSVNNSWPALTYEGVYTLATDGAKVYAGLGNSTGDAEVWMWDGTNWSKIGGDSLNGGWTTYAEQVVSMDYFGGNLYAGIGTGAGDAEVWKWNGTSWSKIGGDGINSGWATTYEIVGGITNDGTNLYAGLGVTAGDSEVWKWNGTSWSQIGGDSLNSSWDTTIETVRSLRWFGGSLYAGLGDTAGDADVWKWNGTSWSQIGGDGLNNSWAAATYEQVASFAYDGINLYAGLGTTSGDGEVWMWDGTTWSKIGGDGLNNSWQTAWGDTINTMLWDNAKLLAGTYDSAGSGWVYSWDGTTWALTAGNYVGKSWGYYGLAAAQVMQTVGDYLYAGMGNTAGAAVVWRWDGSSWEVVGGQGINGSWAPNTYEQILSMASYKGKLYVGLGTTASATNNDAEVWSWDGTTWAKVGGQGVNGSWPFTASHYGEVDSLAADGTYLYAGLGAGANDGEVWRYDGASWSKIGGDSLNGGWTNYVENVYSMGFYKGHLMAGVGRSLGDAEVWEWNGSSWNKMGGDGLNGSWTNYYSVESMVSYNSTLCVGLGNTAGNAVLWCWDGTAWTEIGGDTINGSWDAGTYEKTKTLAVYDGDLYAGLGNTTGDGEVWRYDGVSWTKIAGNGLNSGWAGSIEEIESFSPYKGKLYAGTGNTANADAGIWTWGNNAFLQADVTSFDTNWHHVAATYDGSTLKLYIDGALHGSLARSLTVSSSSHNLLVGAGYGGREFGKPQARFAGLLDEIRLSDIARTSFVTKPYADTYQTLSPTTSTRENGVWHWDTLTDTEIPTGELIQYRISNDDGATWLYWDGTGWSTSSGPEFSNTPSVISAHFTAFPVSFSGMKWQAVFKGDGTSQLTLDGVNAEATSDSTIPSGNASNIQAYKVKDGQSLAANAWTNGASPYFSWNAGTDTEAGIYGYCAYLGTDNTADPTTTKGMLGASQLDTGGHCSFVVDGTSLDLAATGVLNTPLTSSNNPYYLTLRAIDKAGNVMLNSAQFAFRFDNTLPSNPGFITAPSGFINTKQVDLTWPSSGTNSPQDANSGIAGLQYRIGATGQWYGDNHTGSGDVNDLLTNDGIYSTQETPDFDDLSEGVNTVYFRTWDNAGNYSQTYTTATLKINTTGAPSEPNNLAVTPASSTTNSFGFDWDAPTTYVGEASHITYCYTVNTLPSASSCNYTGAGSTELTVGAYATQPGTNTLYVVARDESSNINYANAATVTFVANTTAPGMPLNTDIVDVSIKSTSNWRLALTWDPPAVGSGDVQSYRIYRSLDNTAFALVGTSTSTTYIDASLSQQAYYYRVSACDNTNNCGATGSTVSEYPTGKFTSPATLVSGPTADDITTKRATVSWSTDRASDSKIALGTTSGSYSPSEIGNSDQVSAHQIQLDNLAPGTTYYYKVKWTDEDGNTGASQEMTFTTAPAPTVKEVTISDIGLSDAKITFTIRGATKAGVYYGPSESFGGLKEINTADAESTYEVPIADLTDGTKYYYMVSATDSEGSEYRGQIASFVTPERPHIANLRFQPIDGEPTSTQQVTWTTNVPSTSSVIYTLVNGQSVEVNDTGLVTEHSITIRNLRDDSEYSLIAQSRDATGNLATSDSQSFRTALDTRPPKVGDIVVEASIRGSGSDARGQIVVSWHTDEPSTSQVAYSEGSEAATFNSRTAVDTTLTTEHVVIISDLPTSRVYSIQPVSSDAAGNAGTGQTQTAIIGRASDSALTIVFNALKSIFGL